MNRPGPSAPSWPPLRLEDWRDTCETLHMWTQVVGKVCLAMSPRVNHFWNVTFRVTPRGLATPLLSGRAGSFMMLFDFCEHRLKLESSNGRTETVELRRRTVADFYMEVMRTLARMGIGVRIRTLPVEVPDPIPFERDQVHRSYDPGMAEAFSRALVSIEPVFQAFRADFLGKCSPVHFFWGSFDLAVTRFSGRRAPERPGADTVTRESYSHEVISHGFWPGGGEVQEAVFYAYAAPEPDGFREAAVRPAAAFYHPGLSEFLLPYEAVRAASVPEALVTEFLESTYEAGADLGRWNRAELERGSS
jgi:hypothetical protein